MGFDMQIGMSKKFPSCWHCWYRGHTSDLLQNVGFFISNFMHLEVSLCRCWASYHQGIFVYLNRRSQHEWGSKGKSGSEFGQWLLTFFPCFPTAARSSFRSCPPSHHFYFCFPYTLQISANQQHHQAHRDRNIRGQNDLDGNDRETGIPGALFSLKQ